MDNTLDSVRPSTNIAQDEMSYLYGRDPSILAYGQRPCPSRETKKNLLSLYETVETDSLKENSVELSQSLQTVKVYLRMKPLPKKLKLTNEQQEAYKITSATTLATRLPTVDSNTSCFKRSRSIDIVYRTFTFTQTFGPEVTQLELFQQVVEPQMIDFLTGQNCSIMTYGTTNSGKSYTLQGTTTSPGIILRGLEYVFSNITPKSVPSYKPVQHCDVLYLNAFERAQELEAKVKLLNAVSLDKNQCKNTYTNIQKILQQELSARSSHCSQGNYSVWVSFAEIYNETIYDLLSNECQKKKQPLKLGTDSHGRTFIKGLKSISVNSGAEAYQVLMAGQYNLKVAATALNARSSRSHCIFTIKLLQYSMEDRPDLVKVSMFTFCDLAGSERLKKTLNIGDRLKEAQNINTSLLVLGKCLKSIHEGQLTKHNEHIVGPFRESKLTRLFQRALSGKEQITLIVNVNPIPNLYIETQNVLNFSAIAKKIIIEQKSKERKKPNSRFSKIVRESVKTVTDWDTEELESTDDQYSDVDVDVIQLPHSVEYEELLNENKKLKKDIADMKNTALERDLQIREEMADTYTIMMRELENNWKARIKDVEEQQEDVLQWSIKQIEHFYEQKISCLNGSKRKRPCEFADNSSDSEDDTKNTDLKSENSQLISTITSLKNNIKDLKQKNKNLLIEKNKASFELSLVKDDLKITKNLLNAAQEDFCVGAGTECLVRELKSQLLVKQEHVKKLKEILNEAKEDYIIITDDIEEKKLCIQNQEKKIVEYEEKIEELEEHLGQVNFCFSEKIKIEEILEDKIEQQMKTIRNTENKVQYLETKVNGLQDKNIILLEKIKLLQETKVTDSPNQILCKQEISDVFDNFSSESKHQNNAVEEKVISDTEISVKTDEIVNEIIVGKIDEELERNIITLYSENSALSEKLIQNENEIQCLSDTLESTKEQFHVVLEQLYNLNMINENIQIKNTKKEHEHSMRTEIKEFGCQVDISIDNHIIELIKESAVNDDQKVENKSSQTNELITKEEINQTSFTECIFQEESVQTSINIDEELQKTKEQFVELNVKYNNIQEKFKEEISKHKELEQALEDHNAKCLLEHETKISELQEELSTAKENNHLQTKSLSVHTEKIEELEHRLETMADLKEEILKLSKNLEVCLEEKENLQIQLKENKEKYIKFQNKFAEVERREKDKDDEIIIMQRELKNMINKTESDDTLNNMERELKSTLRELTETKDVLCRKEKYVSDLELRMNTLEQKTQFLDIILKEKEGGKTENEKLRNMNDMLKENLATKEREFEEFTKNRNDTVTKYENLVKSLQEDLERQKREVMRYQELFSRTTTPTPNKDEYRRLQSRIDCLQEKLQKYELRNKEKGEADNHSEDDVVLTERLPKRRIRKNLLSPAHTEIPVIELSGSESKRCTRRAALAASDNKPPSTEIKRTTRRKKLFIPEDESFKDIEPCEDVLSSTSHSSSNTRSLRRNKRK